MNYKKLISIGILICILVFLKSNIQAQNYKKLLIENKEGIVIKTMNLPLNSRIVTIDDNLAFIQIDSISGGKIYGNKGKDSLNLETVKCIHTRGVKEFVKYTALSGSSAYMAGLLFFSVYALNYPVFKDSPNGNIAYVGLAFTGLFAGLSTLIYHYPRTRFPSKKFRFKTE